MTHGQVSCRHTSLKEVATALGIAVPTAKQWWAYARAWLTVEIRGQGSR